MDSTENAKATPTFSLFAKLKLASVFAITSFVLFLVSHFREGPFKDTIVKSYAITLAFTFIFFIVIYCMSSEHKAKRAFHIWTAFLTFIAMASLVPPDKQTESSTVQRHTASAGATNIIEVNQPRANATQLQPKLNAAERKAGLAQQEDAKKLKAQQTCLDVYHSVENIIENHDVMALSQYAYQVYDKIPEPGLNEGCSQLKLTLFSIADIWKTGNVPAPAEFEHYAKQLNWAKQLLQDPKMKLADFNAY